MDLLKILSVTFCAIIHCQYEFPQDPLADQRTDRTGRDFIANEDVAGLSFPTAVTRAGVVEGYFMKSIKGRTILAFEGIPYGEDTGGSNRFMVSLTMPLII